MQLVVNIVAVAVAVDHRLPKELSQEWWYQVQYPPCLIQTR
jgi:hypothetical protein